MIVYQYGNLKLLLIWDIVLPGVWAYTQYVFLYILRYLIYNKNIKSCRGGRLQILISQKIKIPGVFRNKRYKLITFPEIHKTKPESQ